MNKPFHLVNKKNEAAELQIKAHRSIKSVQSPNHICPTLTTMQGGHREPKILQVAKTECRFDQESRVYGVNGISPTPDTMQGGWRQPCILCERISQDVKVRKYGVNIEKLKEVLKNSKKETGLSINQIADKLNIKNTTVSHWFRSDNCFSIPDEDIWMKLKEFLKISTDEFDSSIMEFEYKPNEFDMSNRVYRTEGISPTLTASGGENEAKKILISQATKKGYIEMDVPGVCDLSYPNSKTRRGRVQENGKISPALTTSENGISYINKEYRVRKLTPLECWRLMAFTDKDFYKAKNVGISNSQLYKQAGNSIVVKVLEGIFKELFLSEKENNEIDFEIVKLGNAEVEQFKWVI